MADLTITPANVSGISSLNTYLRKTWGETITQGQVVYKKTSTGLYWKADCVTSQATALVAGIAVSAGLVDEEGQILTSGPLNLGAILTQGKVYMLSTAGLIMPVDDLAANDWIAILGLAITTSVLDVNIINFGVQKT